MGGYTASAGTISTAAHGIGALQSRVGEFHRSTDEAIHPLSGAHSWGLLRPVRAEFLSLAAAFKEHLDHMSGAIDGAKKRLNDTAASYSAAETACLKVLAAVGEKQHDQGIRELNPASRFYRDHRTWNGIITSLPTPLNRYGMAGMHAWRFYGDLTSDDKFNVVTDAATLISDFSLAGFTTKANYNFIRLNPLGYLTGVGLGFMLNAFYWTKYVVDWLTGDPIATGRPPTTSTASPKAAARSRRTSTRPCGNNSAPPGPETPRTPRRSA